MIRLWCLCVALLGLVRIAGAEKGRHAAHKEVARLDRFSFAAEDVRAIQKLRRATGLRIWQECTDMDDICSGCSSRIGCAIDPEEGLIRITELRLNNSGLTGELPTNLLATPGELSQLSVLDVSLNPDLSIDCLGDDEVCRRGLCAPNTLSCSSSAGNGNARRELQDNTLSDAAELAAWQHFYDSTGGDEWLTCSGSRANPCNPQACFPVSIDRYVLCGVVGGKTTLLEIYMVNNHMRGMLDDTSLRQMPNLRMLVIANTEDADARNANLIFALDCLNIQRCYWTSQMVCDLANTGLEICPEIPTASPTSSPTRRPTTWAPTLSPTRRPTTLAPTTAAPTTLSPTSKAPTKTPTNQPTPQPITATNSPVVPSPAPTRATSSPTIAPTRFPTNQPTVPGLPQRDLEAWRTIYTALRGENWDFCDHSNKDPCNFNTNGCEWHTRITCRLMNDGTLRISELFLSMNNMTGVVPVEAFNVLGPNLDTMDLSVNRLRTSGPCFNFDYCYTRTRCNLAETELTLCAQGSVTLAPTIYTPLPPVQLAAWQKLYDMLNGPNWSDGCSASRENPCIYPQCAQCIVMQGTVYITALYLKAKNLAGYLDDKVFWDLPMLDYIDFADNDRRITSDDCIRAEVCYKPTAFCDFTNSGVSLCPDSWSTLAPALSTRPELQFQDLIAFYRLYDDLNGPNWDLPSTCQEIGVDPCRGCPNRIKCIVDPQDGRYLVIQQLLLANTNLRGVVPPATPFQRLFSRGLTNLDMSGSGNQLRLSGSATCLSLPECYDGKRTCNFVGSGVTLCPPPSGSPPTVAPTQPTRQPTFNQDSPCRTTGGMVPEGMACVSPFRYASIQFSACISFTERPPLSDGPYNEPRIPTDMWCPTVPVYNLETKDSWGFCDCTSQSPTSSSQTQAPFSLYTLAPTGRPTTPTTLRPTTHAPSNPGATRSPTKTPTTSAPTGSPTRKPTQAPTAVTPPPTTLAPTKQPTTGAPTTRSPTTTSSPTKAPTSLAPTKAPTNAPTKAPTTGSPTKAPTSQAPTKSPTLRPGATRAPTTVTTAPTKAPTSQPSTSPTHRPTIPTSSPTTTLAPSSNSPSISPTNGAPTSPRPTPAPTQPTSSPVLVPAAAELAVWHQIYDSLGGSNWIQCANMRDNPCRCQATAQVFISCTRALSGRRRLEEDVHITDISLPSNNLVGTLPASVQQLPELQSLNLEGNQVQLPPGSTCASLSVCSKACQIGNQCSTITAAPTSSRGGGGGTPGGVIAAIVIIVLLLVFLIVLFIIHKQCPERLPKSINSCFACACCAGIAIGAAPLCKDCCKNSWFKSSEQKDGELYAYEMDEEYGDPGFRAKAQHVMSTRAPLLSEQRPDGHSHFSLMRGESLPALKDNPTLSEAKLEALSFDDSARKDVADLAGLLQNIGLSHRLENFNNAGVDDVLSFMRLKEDGIRGLGLTIGERVKVKRTIDVRKGLPNDPVFGSN